jgi:acyl carrier protein
MTADPSSAAASPSREELDARLRRLVAVQLDIAPSRLGPDVRLGEDLCVDSLSAVELGLVIEDEFDIELSDEQRDSIDTYGDMVQTVAAALDRQSAGVPPAER